MIVESTLAGAARRTGRIRVGRTAAASLAVVFAALTLGACGTDPGAGSCPDGQVSTAAGCSPASLVADGGGFGEGEATGDASVDDTTPTPAPDAGAADAISPPDVSPDVRPDASPDADPVPDVAVPDAGPPDADPVDADPFDAGGPDAAPDVPICVPMCDGLACGPDGCGGECGVCDAGTACNDEGLCEPTDPTAGDALCVEVARCYFDCRNDGCREACLATGTLDARDEFDATLDCGRAGCDARFGSEEWIECVEDVCPTAAACFDGPDVTPSCTADERAAVSRLEGDVADAVLDCGDDCLDELGEDQCARACTSEALGIAESCGVCTGELALCIADDCDEACGGRGGIDRDCMACMAAENCSRDYQRCIGSALPFP